MNARRSIPTALMLVLAATAAVPAGAVAGAPASPTARAAAAVPAVPATAPDAAGRRARTLDAITIEGDIEAPQVQFITSRDRQRFADDAGRRYRPDALAVLDQLRAPVRLRIVAPPGCPHFEPIPSR